jgi:5-methylcytosine-specific restriction endonuclease McrA
MNVKEYLYAKYGNNNPTTMLSCEAKALGIDYPLSKNWLRSYGEIDITSDTAIRLKNALLLSDKASAVDGLNVLDKAWIELQSIPDVKSKEFLDSKTWKRLRYKALKLNGMRCQCCGHTPQSGACLNVDHILPRLLFPKLALQLDNLQVLCSECNEGKANWDMTNFKQ